MSQRITPGMRAVSLPVFNAEVNFTGGFIVDGDKVDLLLPSTPDGTHPVNTQMVMQNVNVLYVPGPPIKTDKTDRRQPGSASRRARSRSPLKSRPNRPRRSFT